MLCVCMTFFIHHLLPRCADVSVRTSQSVVISVWHRLKEINGNLIILLKLSIQHQHDDFGPGRRQQQVQCEFILNSGVSQPGEDTTCMRVAMLAAPRQDAETACFGKQAGGLVHVAARLGNMIGWLPQHFSTKLKFADKSGLKHKSYTHKV